MEEREHAHFKLSPEVRHALRLVVAERKQADLTQSDIVEEALRDHPKVKVKLANGRKR